MRVYVRLLSGKKKVVDLTPYDPIASLGVTPVLHRGIRMDLNKSLAHYDILPNSWFLETCITSCAF